MELLEFYPLLNEDMHKIMKQVKEKEYRGQYDKTNKKQANIQLHWQQFKHRIKNIYHNYIIEKRCIVHSYIVVQLLQEFFWEGNSQQCKCAAKL